MKTLLLTLHPDFTVASIEASLLLEGVTIRQLADDLAKAAEAASYRIVIDFAAVERISSSVLGNLVALRKKVRNNLGRMVLCNIGPSLKEALKVTGLRILFDVVDDATQAVEFMRVEHVSWREDVK